MKKFLTLLLVGALSTMLLSACGGNQEASTDSNKEKSSVEEQGNKHPQENIEKTTKETTDKKNPILSDVGQSIKDQGVGTITLDKITNINKVYEIAGFKIKLLDAKVLTITNIEQAFKDNVASIVDVGDEFTYLQVRYDLENTTKETVIFNGFEFAVPDNGKQIDVMNSDVLAVNSSEIQPHASTQNNLMGIPVDKNIKSIRLKPSDVLYDNKDHSIFYPKELKIQFK